MPQQPSFPPEVLAALGEVYAITSPKQGATSQVWIVECTAGTRVVKCATRSPFVDWLMREGFILEVFTQGLGFGKNEREITFPFPKLYLDGTNLDDQPIPYLVMSVLPGEPLSNVMASEDDPTRRLHWMSKFGVVLRQIHDTPAKLMLRYRIPWLDERLNTAASYIEAGYDLDADDPPHLLEYLSANRPKLVPQRLIHGDFMWDNVLVDDGEISGIVDWGGGAYGDPRYDLALAILPHEDGELSDAEVAAFYAAYGCEPLTDDEYRYFTDLYGFF
jgi:aminoglycoside phosphotransferase (APT) family kinase protein